MTRFPQRTKLPASSVVLDRAGARGAVPAMSELEDVARRCRLVSDSVMALQIRDYRGHEVRLTDERLDHIVRQHPEVARLGLVAIERALGHPDVVVMSPAAPDDRLYYRRYLDPDLGEKFFCVVVKAVEAFVITAYVTGRQKKGVRVWPEIT